LTKQTFPDTENEALGGLPVVVSYPLDLPKQGSLKRKKFDAEVTQLFYRMCGSKE
jgi:hypothetical protein